MSEVGEPVPPMLSSADESIQVRKPLLSILLSIGAARAEEPEAKLEGGERDLQEGLSKISSPIFVSVCVVKSLSSFRGSGWSTPADDSETTSQ